LILIIDIKDKFFLNILPRLFNKKFHKKSINPSWINASDSLKTIKVEPSQNVQLLEMDHKNDVIAFSIVDIHWIA
jgi:hypothetical protein